MFIMDALPKTLLRLISDLVWKVYISTAKSLWQVVPYELFSEFSKIDLYGIEFNAPPQDSPDGYAKVTFCRGPENLLIELVEQIKNG